MALEGGVTYIEDLVDTNPVGATDNVDEGDDHIRNIKTAVQGSFPNLGAAAVTATAAELNYTDVSAAGTAEASKAVVLDASKDVTGINDLTATTVISDLTGNVTGDLTGDVTGNVTGVTDVTVAAGAGNNDALLVPTGTGVAKIGAIAITTPGEAYGGLVFLQGQTASSSNTIDFSSWIDGTYESFMLELVSVKPDIDAEALNVRVQSAAAWKAADYTHGATTGASEIPMNASTSDTVAEGGVSGRIWFYDPEATNGYMRIQGNLSTFQSGGSIVNTTVTGAWVGDTTAVTGIRIFFDAGGAGHQIASGFFRLYGVTGAVS